MILNDITLRIGKQFSTEWLNKVSKLKLIVPLYHIITDNDAPHIKHLYKIKTVAQFINDLDYLLKFYNPISYDDFLKTFNTKLFGKKPNLLLTFDDGLKEFYSVITPILLQKGIPAICFLNSAFIDNKSLFYRYKISLLIDKIQKENSQNKVVSEFPELFDSKTKIFSALSSIKYNEDHILNDIANFIGLNFNSYLEKEQPYLSSRNIKELINQGFHFGAHSIDHPRYSEINLQDQFFQTKNSVEIICNQFNLKYKAFAFPFSDKGVNDEFFLEIYKDIVDYTFSTSGLKIHEFARNINRIPFENTSYNTKSIINSEIIKNMVWSLIGKNRIAYE